MLLYEGESKNNDSSYDKDDLTYGFHYQNLGRHVRQFGRYQRECWVLVGFPILAYQPKLIQGRQNPEWYTPAIVEQAVNSWIAVSESSREYCRVVGNFAPETPETLKHNFFLTNTKYVAAAKAMFAEKPQSFSAATTIPHPAELIVGHDEKAAMSTPEAAVLFTSRNRVSEMLRAPDYKPFSIRRSQLTRTAGELETLSSGFRYAKPCSPVFDLNNS